MTQKFLCTLTGADDRVNPTVLADLSDRYPFVEWGILFYPKATGGPRYPSYDWIDDMVAASDGRMNLSAHLCGDYAYDFIKRPLLEQDKGDDILRWNLGKWGFGRIQLNAMFMEYSEKGLNFNRIEEVGNAIKATKVPVITQYWKENSNLWFYLRDIPNHQVLFDGSRGNGKRMDEWICPLPNTACGWAGGITPETMREDLGVAKKLSSTRDFFWLDAESGIRTDNLFDKDKAETMLRIFAEVICS